MAFILAALLLLAPFVVLFLVDDPPAWALRRVRKLAATRVPPAVDPPVIAMTAEETARCEMEGLLARRLTAGEVDRTVYHDAMAELAVRDARSRPLRIPGDPTG